MSCPYEFHSAPQCGQSVLREASYAYSYGASFPSLICLSLGVWSIALCHDGAKQHPVVYSAGFGVGSGRGQRSTYCIHIGERHCRLVKQYFLNAHQAYADPLDDCGGYDREFDKSTT